MDFVILEPFLVLLILFIVLLNISYKKAKKSKKCFQTSYFLLYNLLFPIKCKFKHYFFKFNNYVLID